MTWNFSLSCFRICFQLYLVRILNSNFDFGHLNHRAQLPFQPLPTRFTFCKPLPKELAVTQSLGNIQEVGNSGLCSTFVLGVQVNPKPKNAIQQWLDSANKQHYTQQLPTVQMANCRYLLLAKFPSQKRLQQQLPAFCNSSPDEHTNNTAAAPLMSQTGWLKYSRGHIAQASFDTRVFQQTGETIPQ